MSRLKDKYNKEVKEKLIKQLGLINPNQVPKLIKIVVNSGLGDATKDSRIIDMMTKDISLFTGQKPLITNSKKDISNFNRLRKGQPIGAYATLRNEYMWDMLDKLITSVLPGIRDFRGLSKKSFDSSANYSIGIRQHTAFFEVDQNKLDNARGVQVTIVTSTNNIEHSYLLLKELGLPFRD